LKGLKGFFYQNEYYLLPDGYASAQELPLLEELWVKHLFSDDCVPPDFVEEESEWTALCLEEPAYPATVNLHAKADYERQIFDLAVTRCDGCAHANTGCERLGSLSLSGLCYIREGEEDVCFAEEIYSFVERLSENLEQLALCVDEGNQKAFSATVHKLMDGFFLPAACYGGVTEDGRYFLAFSGNVFSVQGFSVIMSTVCAVANDEKSAFSQKGWVMYPYFPKDIYAPKTRPDYTKHPPRIFCREQTESGEMDIYLFVEGAEEWPDKLAISRNKALYAYLCNQIGEDLLLAGASGVRIVGEIPDGADEVTAQELLQGLEKLVKGYHGYVPYPAPYYLKPSSAPMGCYPYKEGTTGWMTVCPEFSPAPEDEDETETMKNLFLRGSMEALGIGYAYLFFPSRDDEETMPRDVFDEYLINEVEKLESPYRHALFAEVGVVETDEGECEDFMLFDEKGFFDVLARLTPLLVHYGVKIVVVKGDGATVFDPAYEIRPADMNIYS
jgi:hypothetical protein